MKTTTSKVGESAHKITKSIILIKRGLKVSRVWSAVKRLKFMVKETIGKAREWQTNGNGLGVKLGLKNSKARLGEIEVVGHVNKMAHP
jgi:hypothetical protein